MTNIRPGRLPLAPQSPELARAPAPVPAPLASAVGVPSTARADVFSPLAPRLVGFADARPAVEQGQASRGAAAARQVLGGAPPEALRVQHQLSETRQRLGAVLEQQAGLQQQAGDAVLAGAHEASLKRLSGEEAALRGALATLQQAEAAQPRADVERASFEVFFERFEALEKAQGPEAAARLARQTWYNDRKFNVAGGSRPATEAQLLKAGFPTSATMRSPSAERIDMGHVACALDWELNPSVYHGLLVDLEQVTFTGDLAAAAQAVAERGLDGEAALDQQAGAPDLLGDYDGLNLAARIRADRTRDVSAHLRAYYADGPEDRLGELAQHSRFFIRDPAGSPQRDAEGRLRVDRSALTEAVRTFTQRLDVVGYGGQGVSESELHAAVEVILDTWAQRADLAM